MPAHCRLIHTAWILSQVISGERVGARAGASAWLTSQITSSGELLKSISHRQRRRFSTPAANRRCSGKPRGCPVFGGLCGGVFQPASGPCAFSRRFGGSGRGNDPTLRALPRWAWATKSDNLCEPQRFSDLRSAFSRQLSASADSFVKTGARPRQKRKDLGRFHEALQKLHAEAGSFVR